jgi:tetratricopeptide (TPR) repeat protein
LHFAKSDFDAAQRDLERAVRLMDWADRSFPWVEDANRDEVDLRPLRLIAESVRKSMAVLLYHRGRIYEAQGRHDLAVADFERITKLGFPLDDHLF